MMPLYSRLLISLERFEHWFDRRFGWFFTNGMKHRSSERPEPGTTEQAPVLGPIV